MDKFTFIFACDNNYSMPFVIAVHSLLDSREHNHYYDIHCFVPADYTNENKAKSDYLKGLYRDFNINYIDVKGDCDDFFIDKHLTTPTYYRLLITKHLPECDNCLYLDVDLIVNKDVTEIWDIDHENYYLLAVKSDSFRASTFFKLQGIDGAEGYFNAGVLFMNLKKIKEDSMDKQFLKLAEENDFPCHDQDVLNLSCHKKVKFINSKYNYFAVLTSAIENKCNCEPLIIHFNSKVKPWNHKGLKYQKKWEYYYMQSIYKNIVLKQASYQKKLLKIKLVWLIKVSLYNLRRVPILGVSLVIIRNIVWKKSA